MERQIEIRINENVNISNFRDEALCLAIGYASLWGNADKVSLYIDKDLNIDAAYFRDSTPNNEYGHKPPYFFMGGIRHKGEKHYSFHS